MAAVRIWPVTCRRKNSLRAVPEVDHCNAFVHVSHIVCVIDCVRRLRLSDKPRDVVMNPLLPASAAVLSLQLCPLRRTLYVTAGFPKLSSPPTDQAAVGSSSAQAMPGAWCVDKLYLDEGGRKRLQTLLRQHSAWVDATTKHVAAYSDGMLGGMDYEGYVETQRGHVITDLEKTILKAEHALEEQLRALLEALEALLQPVLGKDSEVSSFLAKHVPAGEQQLYCTLLLGDDCLQALPWEAMSALSVFRGHVMRDYSISVLGNRLKQCAAGSAVLSVSAAGVQCVVDPFGDDDVKHGMLGEVTQGGEDEEMDGFGTQLITHGNMEQNKPRPNMKSVLKSMQAGAGAGAGCVPGGEKWTRATPVTQASSAGGGMTLQDWISVVGSSGGAGADVVYDRMLFAFLPGRLVGSLLTPRELVNLDCRRLALAFVADWTQTDSSYRRQQSIDSRKQPEELSAECPRNVAALLSLAGVGCVVVRQWSSPPTALDKCSKAFWTGFANENKTVLQAMAAFRSKLVAASIPKEASDESGGPDTVTVTKPLRRWVRYAEASYGIGNITYSV